MKSFNFSKCVNYAGIGAVTAFIVTALLILSISSPNPVWGKNWFIKPLLVTPFVASLGGTTVYLINQLKENNLSQKYRYTIFSIIAFLFSLWIGTILGFDGTLWN